VLDPDLAAVGLVTLADSDGEEISDLAPIHCSKDIRASMAKIVDGLKTQEDLKR
jgi:hypothetical protein